MESFLVRREANVDTLPFPHAEEGSWFGAYLGSKKLALAYVSRSVEDFLSPEKKDSKKTASFLDEIGYKGESVAILRSFSALSPICDESMKLRFFRAVMAYYPKSTWIVCNEIQDEEFISLILKEGFVPFPRGKEKEGSEFPSCWIKLYVPKGLCREAYW